MSWKKKFVGNWGRLGMKCKLSDICDFRKGKVDVSKLTLKTYISTENMLPNKGGITEANSLPTIQLTQEYKKGDVLVSNIRPYFKKIWRAKYDGGCSNDVLVFQGNSNIDGDFLYYVLANGDFFDYSMATSKGTKMPRGDKTSIMQYEVPVFDVDTQRKIASVLRCLDEKIELNSTINKNLEQQAQAIFANEFLSLDTLPEGWKQASLIDIADYLNGLAMQKYRPTADESGIPVLKIKELRQGCCDNNSELCSPSIKSDYIIHDGDVIFSWSGSLLVDLWCGGICGLNQHLFKVTSNKYDKWFYYAWTKHHLDRFVAVAADKATTMGHIKRDELAKAEVLIPNEADYNRIGALLQPIYEMIISNRIENKKLAATRDILLPKLMNGEIDMSEVDYE
jgi:type I restriction enzyme S subunit